MCPRWPQEPCRILGALGVIICAWSIGVASATTPFVCETVDSTGIVGEYSSLALDARSDPHICYYDVTNSALKYATKIGNDWWTETIDSLGTVGDHSSLALDADGNAHISYADRTNGKLMYATNLSGSWTTEIVDDNPYGSTPMAVDQQGRPHVGYYKPPEVAHATKEQGSWSVDILEFREDVVGTALALDSAGNPRMSWWYVFLGDPFFGAVLESRVLIAGTWLNDGTLDGADSLLGVPGTNISLTADQHGNPHACWMNLQTNVFKYATKVGGAWSYTVIDSSGSAGDFSSIAVDANGIPHISFRDHANGDLKYATKAGGLWSSEIVDALGSVGYYNSIALDAQGNPHISYYDGTNGDLKFADSAVHILAPVGGETWPVGSLREVHWSGIGPVTILLSVDGGATFDTLIEETQTSPFVLRTPHAPTRFAQVKIVRSAPLSIAFSDSFFTIDASVTLLSLKAEPPEDGEGLVVSWQTSPGIEDLAGYRVESSQEPAGNGVLWRTLLAQTRATSYHDTDGGLGTRYRLTAISGLGTELVLGETSWLSADPLAAWPLPYRGSSPLNVSFATASGPGGRSAPADVSVYDVRGRLVRTLARAEFLAGFHRASWDGLDAAGHPVSPGIYFVRAVTAGQVTALKLTVIR